MKLTVQQGLKEEVYRDIVRIPERHRVDKSGGQIPEGQIRRIRVNKSYAYIIVRGDQKNTDAIIRMDEVTRDKLMLEDGQTVDVEFDRPLFCDYKWAWGATEIGYKVASRLSMISFILGIFGLVLGFIALRN